MSETRFFYSEKTLTIVLGELSTIRRGKRDYYIVGSIENQREKLILLKLRSNITFL